ncbi:hypothetical protein ACXO1P_08685 [Lactobacillus delbrueckii subsp. bulgaricus]|uniref:hypothetical protein n=1 Tax=Lactobacillus delbrueckii TaxID=1584 RepID=UPI001BFFAB44|nr:hypothetical protein [Lactobacillus delbrueckii]MBT8937386.1 hypothetical protein [Lactobacillus delbrueckii subsp. bulgaricus]MBT8948251.1 hypothetical protein [Lactobacillus delbrueckii subsp. bulgaricus]MBT8949505.1 hypothetical protein [Lactobacillus delbrueckii subsp. bulgaricus]MBT8953099.1 hypothetical protein [Lactobacillus delbrueckii subsp. bulgaricus]MBT8960721.1 hypothetical protein [Lactobacillus delbrueckii subsp. bulgaricus]
MKRLEKGVIGLILVIFAGTVIMAVSSGGQKAESSSDAFDTSEYRKAVKSTDNHHFKNMKVELSGKKSKRVDLDFTASKKDSVLISKQTVKLLTPKGQELTHAMVGEIGYDPDSDKVLIFASDKNYSRGFYPLGNLKRNEPSPASLSADQDPLEFSFKD